MSFINQKIEEYITEHSQAEPELLRELNKETWQKVINPRMLSGHYQGRILSMISKLLQPITILEIGTYTGYSALCLAEGLQKKGNLITIDLNEELQEFSKKYFEKSPYKNQISQLSGNALDIIPSLKDTFDLVFIDADKKNYVNYFNLIIEKMKPGSVILSDNVLWSGKVMEEIKKNDKDTSTLQAYNNLLHTDERVETIMLPIRDGLTISRVK